MHDKNLSNEISNTATIVVVIIAASFFGFVFALVLISLIVDVYKKLISRSKEKHKATDSSIRGSDYIDVELGGSYLVENNKDDSNYRDVEHGVCDGKDKTTNSN